MPDSKKFTEHFEKTVACLEAAIATSAKSMVESPKRWVEWEADLVATLCHRHAAVQEIARVCRHGGSLEGMRAGAVRQITIEDNARARAILQLLEDVL